jgi:hypothetical protein
MTTFFQSRACQEQVGIHPHTVWRKKSALLPECPLAWCFTAHCWFKPKGNFRQFSIATCLCTLLTGIADFSHEPSVSLAIAALRQSELSLRGTDVVVESPHEFPSPRIRELVLVGNSVQDDFRADTETVPWFRMGNDCYRWILGCRRNRIIHDITEVSMLLIDSRVFFLFFVVLSVQIIVCLISKGDVTLEIEHFQDFPSRFGR